MPARESVFTVVITDYEFPDLVLERAVFDGQPVDLRVGPFESREALVEACRDAHAILNQYTQLDAEFIGELRCCRVISRYGVGVNTIDVDAATRAGIMVANVPDGSVDDVSDHAAAMILGLARGVGIYDRALRAGSWDYTAAAPLHRLRGATLGLIGFGNIPQRLAAKMAGFGMEAIAYDPYLSAEETAQLGAAKADLPALLERADVVSVHVPLSPTTRGFIGEQELSLMKPTATLVNTARGGVVDEEALAAALRTGRLAGAGLDVFAHEPLPAPSPLRGLENVLLSPHAAWYSEESEREIRTKTARNVLAALLDGRPTYFVNPAVLGVDRLMEAAT